MCTQKKVRNWGHTMGSFGEGKEHKESEIWLQTNSAKTMQFAKSERYKIQSAPNSYSPFRQQHFQDHKEKP